MLEIQENIVENAEIQENIGEIDKYAQNIGDIGNIGGVGGMGVPELDIPRYRLQVRLSTVQAYLIISKASPM